MKKYFRIVSAILAVCVLLGSGMLPVRAANPGGVQYLNTHVNTGHQRQDILAVAMTQLGYTEKKRNDTKYGDWFGYPGYDWCAMFVSWCARQAEIPEDVIKQCSWAHPNTFGIPYRHGSKYTPKPGDLFFSENFAHVGLVLSVEGDCFYSIEGNAKYHDINIPDDPSEESYYVMTNKRKINKYYYGIPAYKGDDLTHDYVRGFEKAHPHKIYYQCRTCGDRFDTGYTECVADCGKCLPCSCDPSHAGYYLVSSSDSVKIRKSHSTSAGYVGFATAGEAVYVYGADPKSGLAYIEYDGLRGHVELRHLTKYHDIPAAPQVTSSKTDYNISDRITLNWSLPKHTEEFRMKIWKDGVLYLEKSMELTRSYELNSLLIGEYEVQVIACNRSGASQGGTLKFTVRDTYTVTYDARSGSGVPKQQTQTNGEVLTLSSEVPVREGYTFLGWTDDPKGNFVVYEAGDTLRSYDHVTLYAVWKANDAVPEILSIAKLPNRTMFLIGQDLDVMGLQLQVMYSDGTGQPVRDGYGLEGFSSENLGPVTLMVTYEGLTAELILEIVEYIPGDFDGNYMVDEDDSIYLLRYVLFPELYPIYIPGD